MPACAARASSTSTGRRWSSPSRRAAPQILLQLWAGGFSLVYPEDGGGVAFFAHIGGFVFGMTTVYLFRKRRPLRPSY